MERLADGVLVVDATYFPARARADIALIRAITSKPVRYLVNTHWHGDHTHGNSVYRDSFPGLVIIGQEMNRDWIATNQSRYPAVIATGGSQKPATIERLAALLAKGADSTGEALSPAQQTALTENIRHRKVELDEFAKIQVVPPSLLFDENMVVSMPATSWSTRCRTSAPRTRCRGSRFSPGSRACR